MVRERRVGWWRVRDVLVVVGVAYVAIRLRSVLLAHEVWGTMPDSAGYRSAEGVAGPDLVSLRGNAMRPWTVPAIYALVPGDGARAALQVVASIGAWLWLAAVVAREVVRPVLAVVASVAVLVVSSSWTVISFDLAILSESFALTFGAALVAAWIGLLRARSWATAATVVALSTLWCFTRVQHAPVVAISALLAIAVAIVGGERSRATPKRWPVVAGAVGLLAVALWGVATVGPNDRAYAVRDGYGTSLFAETFALNLRFVILPDPEATQWFRDAGMPDPSGLEAFPRPDTIHVDAWESWPAYYERYRADRELVSWVERDGRAAFARWTAVHGIALGGRFASEVGEVLVPPSSSLGYAFPEPVLGGPIQAVVAPEAGPWRVSPVVWLLGSALVLSLVRRGRPPNGRLVGVGAVLVGLSVGALFLAWLGSPVEYTRHAVPFNVALVLGALLVLVAACDDRVRGPLGRPRGGPDADVGAVGGLRPARPDP